MDIMIGDRVTVANPADLRRKVDGTVLEIKDMRGALTYRIQLDGEKAAALFPAGEIKH